MISKFSRNFYLAEKIFSEDLSSRINPDAYISFGTILAENRLIGSIPAHRVQSVKTGKARVYSNDLLTIEHVSIQPNLYFGFESEGWIKRLLQRRPIWTRSTSHRKVKSFLFDPYSDVDTSRLDKAKIDEYLKHYSVKFNKHYNSLESDANKSLEKLMVEVMNLFSERFSQQAILKGGMVLKLLGSLRNTNDLDYVFVPYSSKKDISGRILEVLSDLPEQSYPIQ